MASSANHYLSEKMADAMSEAYNTVDSVGHKLRSFGVLLDRTGDDTLESSELLGLGIALLEMSKELEDIRDNLLDTSNFSRKKAASDKTVRRLPDISAESRTA